MFMTKLYYSPGACSLAPHIALVESGIQFTTEKVDLKAKTTASGKNFLDINPKGQVPTFETKDGKILTENAVILQYIADQVPEKEMLPKMGTWERYHANEMLNFVATEIHKGMGIFFALDRVLPNPEASAEFRKNWTENLARKFDHLATHLKSHTYILGKNFSLVDAYAFTILNWHQMLKVDLTKWPTLMGYMEKVKTQPSVQKAMKEEGLI
jgi:glutathione S-transferase